MKVDLVHEPAKLEKLLVSLTERCARLRWAVAWASSDSPVAKALDQNRAKIDELVVGIHFYQTDPNFIEAYCETKEARFVMQPSGTFHPKTYYFENPDGSWDLVVGSANLTRAAVQTNAEAVLHVQGAAGASTLRDDALRCMAAYEGEQLALHKVEEYRRLHETQRRKVNELAGDYGWRVKGSVRSSKPRTPFEIPLFHIPWNEYQRSTIKAGDVQLAERLDVLERAAKLFRRGTFASMSAHERKCVSGITEEPGVNWLWFGSMRGAGHFMKAINHRFEEVSKALDAIPSTGEVSRTDYDTYLHQFKRVVTNAATATGTRLLALKRPDYFVCLDSKNRKLLCKEFGTSQNVTLTDYWECIVAPVLDTAWWQAPRPKDKLGARIWDGRVALLDARFYDP